MKPLPVVGYFLAYSKGHGFFSTSNFITNSKKHIQIPFLCLHRNLFGYFITFFSNFGSFWPKYVLNEFQEIKQFLKFIKKTGGHEGGWAANDHLLFLKYYNKFKVRSKVASFVRKFLPGKFVTLVYCFLKGK